LDFYPKKIDDRKEASPSTKSLGNPKEVKLELYENMIRKIEMPSLKNIQNEEKSIVIEQNPIPDNKIFSNNNEESPRDLNIEVQISENAEIENTEIPKNLTFRSMLSSKSDVPNIKEIDDSLNISREKTDGNHLVPQNEEIKRENNPKNIENQIKPISESQTSIKNENILPNPEPKPTFLRQKICVILLTIQESSIGDLWPIWLAFNINFENCEKFIGIIFTIIYCMILILQGICLNKFKQIFIKSIFSKILLFLLAPLYFVMAFLQNVWKSFIGILTLFTIICVFERFCLFIGISYIMNQLPKRSQFMLKIRYAVRFFSYFFASSFLALSFLYPNIEKLLFCILAGISILSAILLKSQGQKPKMEISNVSNDKEMQEKPKETNVIIKNN